MRASLGRPAGHRNLLPSVALAIAALAIAGTGNCQTRPATSGTTSFYEPEPDPHHEGWYRPNVPGSPPVSGCVVRSRAPGCRSALDLGRGGPQ